MTSQVFNSSKDRGSHNLPGQPVTVFNHPYGKKKIPAV